MPSDAAMFPRPRTFFWLPLDGARHAAGIHDRDAANGELIATLCAKQITRAPVGETEWLWPTCPDCWDVTAVRVGLRPAATAGRRRS